MMPAAGGEARQVTTHEADDVGPVWSPDGRTLAFSSNRENGVNGIWVITAEGGDARRVTTQAAFGPRWSPDGQDIVYTSRRVPADRPRSGRYPRRVVQPLS